MSEQYTAAEIAASLRVCVNSSVNDCEGCVTRKHMGPVDACDALSLAAAELIEDQAARIEALEVLCQKESDGDG